MQKLLADTRAAQQERERRSQVDRTSAAMVRTGAQVLKTVAVEFIKSAAWEVARQLPGVETIASCYDKLADWCGRYGALQELEEYVASVLLQLDPILKHGELSEGCSQLLQELMALIHEFMRTQVPPNLWDAAAGVMEAIESSVAEIKAKRNELLDALLLCMYADLRRIVDLNGLVKRLRSVASAAASVSYALQRDEFEKTVVRHCWGLESAFPAEAIKHVSPVFFLGDVAPPLRKHGIVDGDAPLVSLEQVLFDHGMTGVDSGVDVHEQKAVALVGSSGSGARALLAGTAWNQLHCVLEAVQDAGHSDGSADFASLPPVPVLVDATSVPRELYTAHRRAPSARQLREMQAKSTVVGVSDCDHLQAVVGDMMASGCNAMLLVSGVDELPSEHQHSFLQWLVELTDGPLGGGVEVACAVASIDVLPVALSGNATQKLAAYDVQAMTEAATADLVEVLCEAKLSSDGGLELQELVLQETAPVQAKVDQFCRRFKRTPQLVALSTAFFLGAAGPSSAAAPAGASAASSAASAAVDSTSTVRLATVFNFVVERAIHAACDPSGSATRASQEAACRHALAVVAVADVVGVRAVDLVRHALSDDELRNCGLQALDDDRRLEHLSRYCGGLFVEDKNSPSTVRFCDPALRNLAVACALREAEWGLAIDKALSEVYENIDAGGAPLSAFASNHLQILRLRCVLGDEQALQELLDMSQGRAGAMEMRTLLRAVAESPPGAVPLHVLSALQAVEPPATLEAMDALLQLERKDAFSLLGVVLERIWHVEELRKKWTTLFRLWPSALVAGASAKFLRSLHRGNVLRLDKAKLYDGRNALEMSAYAGNAENAEFIAELFRIAERSPDAPSERLPLSDRALYDAIRSNSVWLTQFAPCWDARQVNAAVAQMGDRLALLRARPVLERCAAKATAVDWGASAAGSVDLAHARVDALEGFLCNGSNVRVVDLSGCGIGPGLGVRVVELIEREGSAIELEELHLNGNRLSVDSVRRLNEWVNGDDKRSVWLVDVLMEEELDELENLGLAVSPRCTLARESPVKCEQAAKFWEGHFGARQAVDEVELGDRLIEFLQVVGDTEESHAHVRHVRQVVRFLVRATDASDAYEANANDEQATLDNVVFDAYKHPRRIQWREFDVWCARYRPWAVGVDFGAPGGGVGGEIALRAFLDATRVVHSDTGYLHHDFHGVLKEGVARARLAPCDAQCGSFLVLWIDEASDDVCVTAKADETGVTGECRFVWEEGDVSRPQLELVRAVVDDEPREPLDERATGLLEAAEIGKVVITGRSEGFEDVESSVHAAAKRVINSHASYHDTRYRSSAYTYRAT